MPRNSSPTNARPKPYAAVIESSEQHLNQEAARTRVPDRHAASASAGFPPTMFLDFDGTLHVGRASMDERRRISLNTGRPLFEYAPLLIDLLKPYPSVQLVLTTSWLMTLTQEEVVALMPRELGCRVIDTTRRVKSRFGYVLNGTDRTYVIWSYASSKRLTHWLAVDDSVYGAEQFGRTRGELVAHYLLLHPLRGLSDDSALQRIAEWLAEVHS